MSVGDYEAYSFLAARGHSNEPLNKDSKIWTLFQRCGKDLQRVDIFTAVTKNKNQRNFLKTQRGRAVLRTCQGGHPNLLESAMSCLSVMPQDVSFENGETIAA